MAERKQKARQYEKPVNDFFGHAAVQRNDKRVIDAFHVSDSRRDQGAVAVCKEEEVINETEDQSGQDAVIDDVANCQAPFIDADEQRPLEMALARDGQSETAED